MNTNADKTLDYLASAKYIVNTSVDCFNHCVEDFTRKDLIPLEKHCLEGCVSVKFGLYSATANNKT
jgi:hypothetical protein